MTCFKDCYRLRLIRTYNILETGTVSILRWKGKNSCIYPYLFLTDPLQYILSFLFSAVVRENSNPQKVVDCSHKQWAISIISQSCLTIKGHSPLNLRQISTYTRQIIQGESLARGPKLLSMYTVEQRGFLVRKY